MTKLLAVLGTLLVVSVLLLIAFATTVDSLVDVLEAPAVTSTLTVEELVIDNINPDGSTTRITLRGFSVEANSKVLDLILLAAAD